MRVLVTIAFVCVAAVALADNVVYPPQRLPLIFSHAKHAARGTTCATCHATATTSRSAIDNLMPTEAACRQCHPIDRSDPTKAATPVAACAGCHVNYAPDRPVERVDVMPGPIKFDHAAHGSRTCESCHDLRGVDLATTAHLPSMQSCLTCHTSGSQPRNCTQCHLSKVGGLLDTDLGHGRLMPHRTGLGDDHGPSFLRDHKQQARRTDSTCSACHDKSECIECHQGVVKPADFHQGNYLLVHAVEAKRGRPDCSACHRAQTFCAGCHERSGLGTRGRTEFSTIDPQRNFHPPGWATQGLGTNLHAPVARRNVASCASCHRDEDCLQCHSADAAGLRISPHPAGWRSSTRCRMLDRGNRRMCLRCHITEDELGCDWSK